MPGCSFPKLRDYVGILGLFLVSEGVLTKKEFQFLQRVRLFLLQFGGKTEGQQQQQNASFFDSNTHLHIWVSFFLFFFFRLRKKRGSYLGNEF